VVVIDVRKIRDALSAWVGVIAVGLALIIGGTSFYQMREQHEQARELNAVSTCQAEYNAAFAGQLRIRSEIFQASDDTRNDLLGGVAALFLAPRVNDEAEQERRNAAFRKLFEDYLAANQRVEDARKNTPLPPIPDCLNPR
jgi:hypothetical protein